MTANNMTANTNERQSELQTAFRRQFNSAPEIIARAPGRVNLIGEHTDYNEGFVLPVAIEREIMIAADSNSADGRIHLYSLEYEEFDSFAPENIERTTERPWSNYIRGTIATVQASRGKVRPFRAVISGNVPQGAGLSSSAALEVATCTLLNELEKFALSGKEIALLAQKAENEFVGVGCGIMDQFVSSLAECDSALMIDCRDLSYVSIPLHLAAQSVALVITHTGITRGLVESNFNERRAECDEGLRLIKQHSDSENINSLRDVDSEILKKTWQNLPQTIAQRIRHVVSENERVKQAADSLRNGDLVHFGKLMIESHNSLRDDYEVSCKELDILVDLTLKAPGVLGARMTGAGFGGCTVALIKEEGMKTFAEQVLADYQRITGQTPITYVSKAAAGAEILEQVRCS